MNLTDEEKDVVIAGLEALLVKLDDEIGDTDDQDEEMPKLTAQYQVAKRLINRLA